VNTAGGDSFQTSVTIHFHIVQNLQNKVKGMVSQNTTVIFEGAFYLG
jgi:hypothetical protein